MGQCMSMRAYLIVKMFKDVQCSVAFAAFAPSPFVCNWHLASSHIYNKLVLLAWKSYTFSRLCYHADDIFTPSYNPSCAFADRNPK